MVDDEGKSETLPTTWDIPVGLWREQIHPVTLKMDPPKSTVRKRVHPTRTLDGIIFWMRNGCHWNRLPKPQSTERGRVRGLLKGQKGAPLNLG